MSDATKDDTLKALLADYAAPTPDDGFSDAVMRAVQSEAATESLDLEIFRPRGNPIRRSWIVSLVLGLIVGLLWVRLGVSLPDMPEPSALPRLLDSGWGLYAVAGVALAGLFLFMEAEAY